MSRSLPGRWRANVLLLIVTTLLCIAAMEAVARISNAAGPTLLQMDPVVGKRFRPGFHARVYVPEAGREIDLRFNREGMRGPEWPEVAAPGTRRIAVIGDSMIAAVATDEERTLVRQLQDRLNAGGGLAWEVLNFGVSSSSTGNELVLYRKVAARYRPHLVLCAFFVGNDLADNSHRLTQGPRIYFELDAHGELRRRAADRLQDVTMRAQATDWLDRHSRLYVWQKTALRELKGHLRGWVRRAEPAQWIYSRAEPVEVAEAWRLTGRLLQTFRQDVESHGGRFAVVLIPAAEQIYDDLWNDLRLRGGDDARDFDRDHPERRLGAICRDARIPLIALTESFRARAPRASARIREEWLYYGGRWHLNEEGQRLAAEVVHRRLEPLLQQKLENLTVVDARPSF